MINAGPFSTFAQNFLVGSYLLDNAAEGNLAAGDVLDAIELNFRDGWVYEAIADGKSRGWYQGPALAGGDREQPVWLTGSGMREAERLIQSGVEVVFRNSIDDPLSAEAKSEQVIAKLDRTSPSYLLVSSHLVELENIINGLVEAETAERSRIKAGIVAARELWKAEELEIIQVKVGVLLAVQNASAFLKKLGKEVAIDLIVDGIKAVLKQEATKLLGLST
jgi:hypothetical protein